ncbi:MAG: sugar transporter [Bacteroidales bacterium]|nr:sugar transporter [Bacteroidales bacterium]
MVETDSRVKKSLLNARVNLIFYFLTLLLSFFSRKIFLDTLGADFIGLTGTLYNLLASLNLAELGIATAISYVLYKPLFDHDEPKIIEIVSVLGYLYRWIGLIILVAGIILSAFLPLIYPDTKFDYALIYFAYYSFLASSLIGYFINYRQNLLAADQRNYVVAAYFQTSNIVKILIQMTSAYYTGSYWIWVSIELIFGIGYSFILNWKIDQTYPWLKIELREGRRLFRKYPEVARLTKQLFVHQINGFAQFQTTPLFIYAFVSLRIVAYYGNYTLITDKMFQLLNAMLSSTSAGVGNLIAEGNREKTESVFWELTGVRFWIGGILFFVFFLLMDGFISFWLGSEFLLSKAILLILLVKIYIQITTDSMGQFIYGYGLFADVWASVVQTVVFLVCAGVGGCVWGVSGIIAASAISTFAIVGVWRPYYLYSRGFKLPVMNYWKKWVVFNVLNASSMLMGYCVVALLTRFFPHSTFLEWTVYAVTTSFVYIVISFVMFYLFIDSTRMLLKRFVR